MFHLTSSLKHLNLQNHLNNKLLLLLLLLLLNLLQINEGQQTVDKSNTESGIDIDQSNTDKGDQLQTAQTNFDSFFQLNSPNQSSSAKQSSQISSIPQTQSDQTIDDRHTEHAITPSSLGELEGNEQLSTSRTTTSTHSSSKGSHSSQVSGTKTSEKRVQDQIDIYNLFNTNTPTQQPSSSSSSSSSSLFDSNLQSSSQTDDKQIKSNIQLPIPPQSQPDQLNTQTDLFSSSKPSNQEIDAKTKQVTTSDAQSNQFSFFEDSNLISEFSKKHSSSNSSLTSIESESGIYKQNKAPDVSADFFSSSSLPQQSNQTQISNTQLPSDDYYEPPSRPPPKQPNKENEQ
ncbi:MAG: hypothetical protein EZS28_048102, partial [Streblomastix strix]